MELVKYKEARNHTAAQIDSYFLQVSTTEAAQIIASLARQIADKNPNAGRAEHYTKAGEYFSIAVHPDPAPVENKQTFLLDRDGWPICVWDIQAGKKPKTNKKRNKKTKKS